LHVASGTAINSYALHGLVVSAVHLALQSSSVIGSAPAGMVAKSVPSTPATPAAPSFF